MSIAAVHPCLPSNFALSACERHLVGLRSDQAVRFVANVLVRSLCLIGSAPTQATAANTICDDPRWKLAVSIANPLSLWEGVRQPAALVDDAEQLDRVASRTNQDEPAGLVASAALRLAQAAMDPVDRPNVALLTVIDLAVKSEVASAVVQGDDPARVRADAELAILDIANRKTPPQP